MYRAEWCCMCSRSDAVPLRLCALAELKVEFDGPVFEARPRLSTLRRRVLVLAPELEPVLDTEPAPDSDGDAADPPTVGLCKCAMPGVPGVWGCRCLKEKFLPTAPDPDRGGVSTLREERDRPEMSGVRGVGRGNASELEEGDSEACAAAGRPSERDSGELPSPAAAAVAAAAGAAEAA